LKLHLSFNEQALSVYSIQTLIDDAKRAGVSLSIVVNINLKTTALIKEADVAIAVAGSAIDLALIQLLQLRNCGPFATMPSLSERRNLDAFLPFAHLSWGAGR
jgi:hypothetical protein